MRSRSTAPSTPGDASGYITAALTRKYYEGVPVRRRRQYVAWIETAKHKNMKLRRLKKKIRQLDRRQELGLT
jgi:uncharacterized protein YdeI (YjbR/CyaY-like superfamily)